MLVLFETPAGFALFKVTDESKLDKPDDLFKSFQTHDAAASVVKLKAFSKFEDTNEAVKAVESMIESKLSRPLKKFLQKQIVKKELQDELAVADAKLGGVIKEKLGIPCVFSSGVMELMRGIRSNIEGLLGVSQDEFQTMVLGLSHSLSRHKLQFSTDKVDTMVVQSIGPSQEKGGGYLTLRRPA
jgi:nucleolar protein 58